MKQEEASFSFQISIAELIVATFKGKFLWKEYSGLRE